MIRRHPLERAFVRKPYVTGCVVALAVHIAFDLFTDLPDKTAGVSGRWYVFVPVFFVLASGIVTVVRGRSGVLQNDAPTQANSPLPS